MEDSSLPHPDSAMARGYDLGSCVYSGSVSIHFDLLRSSATRCIILDALDFAIDSASISFPIAPSPGSFFCPVDVELKARRRSGLREWGSWIGSHEGAFYRRVQKNMVMVQFEAVQVTRCFPWWD